MIPPATLRQYRAAKQARTDHACDLADRRVAGNSALVVACLKTAPAEFQARALHLLTTRWRELPGMIEVLADIAEDLTMTDRAEALGIDDEAIETSRELRDALAAEE
jgi:hypothetical protein